MDEQAKQISLLRQYLHHATVKSTAHADAERFNRSVDKKTAAIQGIASLIVGILGVATWNNVDDCGSPTNIGFIATGVVVSFAASAIGVLRTVWRYAAKVATHHTTSGNYADIVTDIELFFAGDLNELEHFVATTHERLDIYDASAAPIPAKYIDAASSRIRSHYDSTVISRHKKMVEPKMISLDEII